MTETPETVAAVSAPSRWRVRNAIVEAIQWNPGDLQQAGLAVGWLMASGVDFYHPDGTGETTTLAIRSPGQTTAWPGDWVIRGVTGLFFAAGDRQFREAYEPVTEAAPAQQQTGACRRCLCDIAQAADGRWRLAWGGSEDPYACGGGTHEPGDAPAPDPAEVPADGGRIVRTGCEGGVLVIAFAPGVPPERIVKIADDTYEASGLKVIALADIAAVKAWHPHAAPAPAAATPLTVSGHFTLCPPDCDGFHVPATATPGALDLAVQWAEEASRVEEADPLRAAWLREHAGQLQRAVTAAATDGGQPNATPPEALIGDLETEAARLTAISSPRGTLGETRAHYDVQARAEGLRDAARSIRERLAPQWDALAAQLAQARALLAEVIGDLEHVVIHGNPAYVDRDMIADYRERAALEAPDGR